jgi:hypothetical protein
VKRPGGRIKPGRIFLLHAVLAAGVGGVLHPCDRGPPTRHVAGQRLGERLGSGRSTASTAASTIALLELESQ